MGYLRNFKKILTSGKEFKLTGASVKNLKVSSVVTDEFRVVVFDL